MKVLIYLYLNWKCCHDLTLPLLSTLLYSFKLLEQLIPLILHFKNASFLSILNLFPSTFVFSPQSASFVFHVH